MMIHMVLSLKIIPKSDVFRLRFSISNGKRYIRKVYLQYIHGLLACLCSNGMHLCVCDSKNRISIRFFCSISSYSRAEPKTSGRARMQAIRVSTYTRRYRNDWGCVAPSHNFIIQRLPLFHCFFIWLCLNAKKSTIVSHKINANFAGKTMPKSSKSRKMITRKEEKFVAVFFSFNNSSIGVITFVLRRFTAIQIVY